MNDDEPTWGFAGLTQVLGLTSEAAYKQIVTNLVNDPGALAIVEAMLADPEGQGFIEQSRQEWAGLGFPPPWEQARKILDGWNAAKPTAAGHPSKERPAST
jgi:hypothetical protein